MVRQRYGTAVNAEVLEESVSEATQQVLTERGLRPALQPKIDVLSLDPSGGGQGPGIQGRARTAAGDHAARLRRDQADPDEGRSRHRRRWTRRLWTSPSATELEPIAQEELGDRGAAKGESADRRLCRADRRGGIPGGTGKDIEVEIGGHGFHPRLQRAARGPEPGETRTIEVTFPAEYGVPTLAGKAASFEVTRQALSRAAVPALDDELAKKLGFEDLAICGTPSRDGSRRNTTRWPGCA